MTTHTFARQRELLIELRAARGFRRGVGGREASKVTDQRRNDLGKTRSEALRAVKAVFGAAGVHGPETVRYHREETGPVAIPPLPQEPCGDTSVNTDIDEQLAAAQRAHDEDNLASPETDPKQVAERLQSPVVRASEIERAFHATLDADATIVLLEIRKGGRQVYEIANELRRLGPAWSHGDYVCVVTAAEPRLQDALEDRMREKFGWDPKSR